ncbi:MAG: hypothetical protein P8102_05520, partial [Gammaproteobacteria bacterium]
MLQTLPLLPMWAGALVMGLLVFGSILAGFWLGNRHRLRHPDREAGPVGAAAGACLGLLAFLLAFNFGTATSRFENRKSLLLEEANAIHTAWLRADLLEDASAARARALLADYLETRIRVNQDNVDDVIREGEDIQDELWAIAVAELRAGPSARLFAQSVNHLVDVQTERVVHSL